MSWNKFLLVFSLILGFGSVVDNFYPIPVLLFEYLMILLSIRENLSFKGSSGKYISIIVVCVIISAIMTTTTPTKYVSFIIRPFVAIAVLSIFQFNYPELKFYFYKCLRLIAWLALANFLITIVASGAFQTLTSGSGYTVHTIGFVFNYIVTTVRFGLEFTRNQGIFWEPGVLEIFMNTLVFIELIEYKSSLKKAWLPILIVITTASTSGYMLLSVIITIWYLLRLKESNGNIKKYVITIFSAIIVFFAIAPLVQEEVTYKATTGVGSANKRQFDLMMGFEIAKDHPLFGIGPDSDKYMKESLGYSIFVGENVTYDARGNSNIFAMLFCYYGFPMALLFLFGLYRQNVFEHKFTYFLIILTGLFSEPVAFVDLYFVWIMSGAYKGIFEKHPLQHEYEQKLLNNKYESTE